MTEQVVVEAFTKERDFVRMDIAEISCPALGRFTRGGLYRSAYDGPKLPHVAECYSLKDTERTKGWEISVTDDEMLHNVLETPDIKTFLSTIDQFGVGCRYLNSPAKLFRLLATCPNCTKANFSVREGCATGNNLGTLSISLPSVKVMDLHFAEKVTMEPFYEKFNDMQLETLTIRCAPITLTAAQKLCSNRLTYLSVVKLSLEEYRLLLTEADRVGANLTYFCVSLLEITERFNFACLQTVTAIRAAVMSRQSLTLLLQACPNVKRLYIMRISGLPFGWTRFASVFASYPLQELGIYNCKWLTLKWFNQLAQVWRGKEKLREFSFGGLYCGLKPSSFKGLHLDSNCSALTDCVRQVELDRLPNFYGRVLFELKTRQDNPPPYAEKG